MTILRFIFINQSQLLVSITIILWLACLTTSTLGESKSATPRQEIDFERHVAPLLGRFGCNSAACHGAFGGKGGLQLSLFGYSPEIDFRGLIDRVDLDDPLESLVLRKPTGLEDHEGGIRFESGSSTYQIIQRWIESGAGWKKHSGDVQQLSVSPLRVVFSCVANERQDSIPLRVHVKFQDGTIEDVTDLCVFTSRDEGIATVAPTGEITAERCGDTSVTVSYGGTMAAAAVLVPFPKSDDSVADVPVGLIDSRIHEKLKLLNIVESSLSSDEEFLRRLMIDTIGTIPTPDEVRHFCADSDPDKREAIIDRMLAHPMHAALWATRMCDITKCDVNSMGDDDDLARRRAQMWHDWFRHRFATNTFYAEIVRGILLATSREDLGVDEWVQQEAELIRQSEPGSNQYRDRSTLDLYWRRATDDGRFPLKEVSELTAVALTGVRLTCAQCHKHPFDRWTQDDYAAFANIFSKVSFGNSTELNTAIFAQIQKRRQAKENGEEMQPLPRLREVFLSEEFGRHLAGSTKGKRIEPRAFDSEPFDPSEDLRKQLFDWLVSPDNTYFAPSFVNRVWAVYFGRGFVDPVDDFSVANRPSHPELLHDLARTFIESDLDIRKLEKRILMSATYQRTSLPSVNNEADQRNFSRQQLRPLRAEVALDVLNKALGVTEDFGGAAPSGTQAIQIGTNRLAGDPGRMMTIFGRGERESICDCDRRDDPALRQFIFLINDSSISEKIQSGSISKLMELETAELVPELYLRMLSRPPTDREKQIALRHLKESSDSEQAFDDLVWALVNSREFLTNH